MRVVYLAEPKAEEMLEEGNWLSVEELSDETAQFATIVQNKGYIAPLHFLDDGKSKQGHKGFKARAGSDEQKFKTLGAGGNILEVNMQYGETKFQNKLGQKAQNTSANAKKEEAKTDAIVEEDEEY